MHRRQLKRILPQALIVLVSTLLLQTAPISAKENVLFPYDGPSVVGTDTSTLKGKIMTGYQGWFNTEEDGANLGWTHWAKNKNRSLGPDNAGIDFWPDSSEYDEDELYDTEFSNPDGSVAKVFSSHNRKTVIRHFQWMAEYGIDGAFIQRFAHSLNKPDHRYHKDKVLSNAREGANRHGRSYAVMYDLTGLPDSRILEVFKDWQMLQDKMQMGQDPAYQNHNGKPLVAIWGVGFNEKIKKRSSLPACKKLIQAFKDAGISVMLGIPTGWRERERDALDHPELHDMLLMADILSPWSISRYKDLNSLERHMQRHWAPDIIWAKENAIEYMPVVYPGFSWHNNKGGELNAIPRLGGQFLWSQAVACKQSGAEMIYIAMFDEVDEGTAIFKCTDTPPTRSKAAFATMEGLPSDFYLRLAGQAGKLLRNEIPMTTNLPISTKH